MLHCHVFVCTNKPSPGGENFRSNDGGETICDEGMLGIFDYVFLEK